MPWAYPSRMARARWVPSSGKCEYWRGQLHGPKSSKTWKRSGGVGGCQGATEGQAKGKVGALANVVNQCPECGRGQRGERRH